MVGPINYFDIPFGFLTVFILGSLVIAIYNYIEKFRKLTPTNTFLEDNPLSLNKQKKDTSYDHLISKIAPALFHDVYDTSFTIGVIGPWGTGKSSFLGAVKYAVLKATAKELKTKFNVDKKPDTIFIEFSPFLNHNEEQVIHEFFTQLSNKLGEKSGKLSNLISVYSEKLANLDGFNSWFSIFNLAKNSRENKSAKELYDEIKDCIKDLNLKIIVTVDDLDRLNAKEILQVLKLIRNTSNFPNMVFLVAMDKEYVNNSLHKEQEYLNQRYLEKFFQLELFLPFNEIILLKQELIYEIKQIEKHKDFEDYSKLLTELTTEVLEPLNLVSSYLRSYRDIKIIRNQIVSELHFLNDKKNELIISEYLKLLLLRIRFPEVFTIICYKPQLFLHKENNELFFYKESFSRYFNSNRIKKSKNRTDEFAGFKVDGFEKNPEKHDHQYTYNIDEEEVQVKVNREILYDPYEIELIEKTLSRLFNKHKKQSKSIIKRSNFIIMINNRLVREHFLRSELIQLIENRTDDRYIIDFFKKHASFSKEMPLKINIKNLGLNSPDIYQLGYAFEKINDFKPDSENELYEFVDLLLKLFVFVDGSDQHQYHTDFFIRLIADYAGENKETAKKTDKKIEQDKYEALIRENFIFNKEFKISRLWSLIEENEGKYLKDLGLSNELVDVLISKVFNDLMTLEYTNDENLIYDLINTIHNFEFKKNYKLPETKSVFLSNIFQSKNIVKSLNELLTTLDGQNGVKLNSLWSERP